MQKISSAKVAEVLRDAAHTIRDQQATIAELSSKLASHDRRGRAEKVASAMHRKGIALDEDIGALIERLEKAAEANKLDTIEQAVEMTGPDMGDKIASLTTHDDPGMSSASTDLERYLIGAAG